jgi:hypothetical protein
VEGESFPLNGGKELDKGERMRMQPECSLVAALPT